jgi:hypothetical protein
MVSGLANVMKFPSGGSMGKRLVWVIDAVAEKLRAFGRIPRH